MLIGTFVTVTKLAWLVIPSCRNIVVATVFNVEFVPGFHATKKLLEVIPKIVHPEGVGGTDATEIPLVGVVAPVTVPVLVPAQAVPTIAREQRAIRK